MPGTLCESPLCDPRTGARRTGLAENALRLCPVCRAKLAKHLREFPALYHRCEKILATRYKRAVDRVRGGMPGGISLNDAAFNVRSDMLSVLASWSGLVVDERPISVAPRRQIGALADFLSTHLEWLAAHPAAGSAVQEVHDVAMKVAAVIDPNPALRMDLGPCAQSGCESTVRARNSAPTTHIGCDAGHVLRPHEWLQLGHRIEQARRAAEARESVE